MLQVFSCVCDLLWIFENLLNGVIEGAFFRYFVPVQMNGVTVVMSLFSIGKLICKDGHSDERNAVVNCFLVTE